MLNTVLHYIVKCKLCKIVINYARKMLINCDKNFATFQPIFNIFDCCRSIIGSLLFAVISSSNYIFIISI